MESWSILIIVALGYLACFLAGLFFAKYKYSAGGLAENTAILSDLTDRIKDTEQRVAESAELTGELQERLRGLIVSGGDLEEIFAKYGTGEQELTE